MTNEISKLYESDIKNVRYFEKNSDKIEENRAYLNTIYIRNLLGSLMNSARMRDKHRNLLDRLKDLGIEGKSK